LPVSAAENASPAEHLLSLYRTMARVSAEKLLQELMHFLSRSAQ
jgi:hypothetical protein